MIHTVNTSYTLYSLFAPISRRLRLKKFSRNFCAITCNISLLLNSFLPYFAAVPAYAEEPTPTPIVESTPAPVADPTIAPVDSPEPTAPAVTAVPTVAPTETPVEPTAVPTEEPVATPVITETPTVTPVVTETPTITPIDSPEPTASAVTSAPSENNNNNQSSGDNSNSATPTTTPDTSSATPTPVFMVPSPTPTPSTRVVEQVCPVAGDTMRDSVELDWNYDCATDTYITREKVQLGVKYIFPKENNVTVTFTSLPKDEIYRSYLKIKQVKTSDLKLPGDIGNVGEYAYDITTDMFDGEFKYDITLPKNPDQTAEISYIEKTLEQAKTGVASNEINSVDESKTEQQDNKVAATNIDHFTIFIATYSSSTFSVEKSVYSIGETVFVKAGDLNSSRYYKIRINYPGSGGTYITSCQTGVTEITGTYSLTSSSEISTDWRAELKSYSSNGNCNSNNNETEDREDSFEVIAAPVTPPVTNPTLPQACGLDIALVLDVSGSIDNAELTQMKTAFKGFVDALAGTPTQFSVTKFDTTASVLQTFTGDSALVKTKIDSAFGGNYTNWQDGFVKTNSTLPNRSNPNLVIFASDGNPNRTGISGTSVSESVAVADAVTIANTIKTGGTRILALGIGSDLDLANMKAISGNSADTGNVLTSDVISTNFSTLAAQLATFATQTCGGTISIRKIITGNPSAPLNNWQFSLGGGLTYPTDAQGYTSAIPVTSGTYSVTEIQKNGYSYTSASCVKNSVPIGSPISNGVGSITISANDIVSCTFTNNYNSSCGDGIVSAGEECDDGNQINTDSCLNTCKSAKCGDNYIGPGEICDSGLSNTNTACTAEYGGSCSYCDTTCVPHTITGPRCGDTIVNGSEECEGNSSATCSMPTSGYAGTKTCNPGSCSWNSCTPTQFCGDGTVNGSETCDEGTAINGTYGHCKADCSGLGERCGDGVKNGSEQCDDGNSVNTDSCLNTCQLATCGDGFVSPSEQCDDGNQVNNDACSNSCKLPICGDGIVTRGEECDDGNLVNTDACLNTCKTPTCGDGYLFAGNEQCDNGALNTNTACTASYNGTCNYCDNTCVPHTVTGPYCGNGIIDGSETCDGTNLGGLSSTDFRCNSCSLELIKSTIDICHSTNADNNPYIVNHPSKSGDVSGHSSDTGPIWYPGIDITWGDIIPPFAYIGGTFPGLNWTTEGQSIYDNGCDLPKGTLIVKKVLTNDNGGTKNYSDFTFNIGDTSYTFENDGQNDLSVTPGKYTITENTAVGYTTTYDNCSNVTVPISGSATCTITNDDIAPQLNVVKTVVPANDPGKFNLLIGSTQYATNVGNGGQTGFKNVSAGTVRFSETAGTGTNLSNYTTTYSTGCSSGQTTLTVGETKTCTITNTRKTGTLQVKKNVDLTGDRDYNDANESNVTNWKWQVNGSEYNTGSTVVTLNTGTYKLTETQKENFHFNRLICTNATVDSSNNVTITSGAHAVCTFENHINTGSIKISKQTYPDRSPMIFTYQGSLGIHTFYDGDDDDYDHLPVGTYTITEDNYSSLDWKLTNLVCNVGTTNLNNRSVTIDLKSGANVECTFTNTKLGSISGHKFNDKNGDNDPDFGENMLNTWQIFIDSGDKNGVYDAGELSDTTSGSLLGAELGKYEFDDLLPGTYRLCETPKNGWYSSLSANANCQDVAVGAGQDREVNIGNHQQVTIRAYKVVCDDESKLPNWGTGAPSINASTAQNFVNTHPGCTLESGWDFQYGFNGQVSKYGNGDQLGLAPAESNWKLLGSTNSSGYVETTISQVTGNGIWVRESLKANYVPFSYPPAGPTADNKTAELYCNNDGEHYDNYDQIASPNYGSTYYCVAFNALKFGHLTVQKTTYPIGDKTNFSVTATGSGTLNGSATGTINDSTDKTYEMTPGTYSVAETVPEGWEQISNNCTDVIVNAGQTPTCEIVNRKLGQINVTKYNDADSSGTQNNGEAVLGAWTITLSNGQTAVTDSSGNVSFDNLTPGRDYILGEEMQPGWTQTNITCTKNNEPIATCGDAVVGGSEQCDDGNIVDNDGCSNSCRIINDCADVDGDRICDSSDNCPTVANADQADRDGNGVGDVCDAPITPTISQNETNCRDGLDNDGDGYTDYDNNDCGATFKLVKSVNAITREIPDGSKEITVNPGDVWTCSIGNQLKTPTATISKSNDASGDLSPGSSVNYKIKVKILDNDVTNFDVTDLLSNGFKYRPGSYSVIKNTTDNITVGTSEPQYHSPGVWHLGDLKAGDVVELSYTADISSDQQPGKYTDLALAVGEAKYESSPVYANGENSPYVSNNFVGTDVTVVRSTQNSVGAGVEKQENNTGEVLGVSTELPSTGSSTVWLIICTLMSLLGFALIKKSSKKILAILLFATLFIFPVKAQAFVPKLSVRLEQPKSPTNLNELKLTFVALELNGVNPITVKCYKKGPSDGAYSQLGADISLNAPGNTDQCQATSSVLNTEGTYQFYVTANGLDSNVVSVDYKTSGPGTPGDYRKEHPNNCDYKIHFKTADDGGKTVKVEVYRADITNFILDAGSVVSSVSVGSNEERDVTNSVPDCNKNYYYVIRAFDNAGNGSSPVGDSVVTSTITTTNNGTTVKTGTGAIPVVNVTLAPGEENTNTTGTPGETNGEGAVLGTQEAAKNFLQKYWLYLILLLVIVVRIIGYVLSKKKNSRSR